MGVENSNYVNRHGMKARVRRLLWRAVRVALFRPTPSPGFHGWRIFLLRLFGAKIGPGCCVYPSCVVWAPWNMVLGDYVCLSFDVDFYSVDKITIGSNVTVSQGAFLCTASHDISDPHMELTTAPITIGDSAWIAARAFVGPGVQVGEGAVVGACAVACKDVAPWDVVAGNPARTLRRRTLRQ